MKIGVIAARLGGVDGVSLEIDEWCMVLKKMGHKIFFCTGEVLGGYGYSQLTGEEYKELKKARIIPEMSFWFKKNRRINRYGFSENRFLLKRDIEDLTKKIKRGLARWVNNKKIEFLIVENASSIPMHIPLGVAIGRLVRGRDIPTILHHHDFYWERKKYRNAKGLIKEYLEEYFPFKHKTVKHVVLNRIAKKELRKRRDIGSYLVPNVFDYRNLRIGKDDYNRDFREEFDIGEDDLIALAPVRVIPRKDIRTAIKIISSLQKKVEKKLVLVVTGHTSDVGRPHERNLRRLAERLEVNIKFIGDRIGARRNVLDNRKVYTVWDAYIHGDFILYPSLIEGWGNAFGEALAFKKLMVVRRYPAFRTDIERYNFNVIAFNKYSKNVVNRLYHALENKEETKKWVEENLLIAKRKLSYKILKKKLNKITALLSSLYLEDKAVER